MQECVQKLCSMLHSVPQLYCWMVVTWPNAYLISNQVNFKNLLCAHFTCLSLYLHTIHKATIALLEVSHALIHKAAIALLEVSQLHKATIALFVNGSMGMRLLLLGCVLCVLGMRLLVYCTLCSGNFSYNHFQLSIVGKISVAKCCAQIEHFIVEPGGATRNT